MALLLPRHEEWAAADLAASHTGLGIPVLPIEGVPVYASAINTGALTVFVRADAEPGDPGSLAKVVASAGRPRSLSPVQNITDIEVLVFTSERGWLPAGAWLSGLTRARAEPRSGVRNPAPPPFSENFFAAG